MRLLRGIDDALSAARNRPARDRGTQLGPSLPGVDDGEWPTVAPEASPHREGGSDNTGVPPGRSSPPADARSPGREQGDGAPAQDGRPSQSVVPTVQPPASSDGGTRYLGATAPGPEVERAALAKAQERDWWRLVSYQPDQEAWYVPSRTVPGEYYVLTVRAGSSRAHPTWWRLCCNCPAETSGKYLACWHKYAVWLRFQTTRNGRSGDTRRGSER